MNSPPWTEIGRLSSGIEDIKNKLYQKAEQYEIHQMRSDVDRLERSLWEACSIISELRSEINQLQEDLRRLAEESCCHWGEKDA